MKKPGSNKAKLELELATIAPFADKSEEVTVTDFIANTTVFETQTITTCEESKIEPSENSDKTLYLVKIRISSNSGKVRRIFLSTQRERTAFIDAIIKAQGFNSQLDQYEVKREIERTSKTSVVIA